MTNGCKYQFQYADVSMELCTFQNHKTDKFQNHNIIHIVDWDGRNTARHGLKIKNSALEGYVCQHF